MRSVNRGVRLVPCCGALLFLLAACATINGRDGELPTVDRNPLANCLGHGALETSPHFDENSGALWQVDLRE